MIYTSPDGGEALTQGDLFSDCPLVYFTVGEDGSPVATTSREQVVILTQARDLAHEKTSRVQVAVIHKAAKLIESGLLTEQTIREQVWRHRVFGWYFLPAEENVAESIVDLRDLHTIPKAILETLIKNGNRHARILSPYREHLAQHFAVTYSRIALPELSITVAE